MNFCKIFSLVLLCLGILITDLSARERRELSYEKKDKEDPIQVREEDIEWARTLKPKAQFPAKLAVALISEKCPVAVLGRKRNASW